MSVDFLERETESSAPAAPLRKAAMLLHSMAEIDRRWMLARVDAVQRQRLEALLQELAALEFPVDAELVRDSLAGDVAAPAARAADLSAWSVDDAVRILSTEPDDLIALLLRAGDWAWAGPLRARLGGTRARAIEESRYTQADQVCAVLRDAALKAARARFLAMPDLASSERPATSRVMPRRAA